MNVSSLCRREVVGVVAGASLEEAATLMGEEHVGSLVVVTKETPLQLVGMLTDRDIALHAVGRGACVPCFPHSARRPPSRLPWQRRPADERSLRHS